MTTEHKVFIGIGLATLLIIGAGVFFISGQSTNQNQDSISNQVSTKPLMGEAIPIQGQTHIQRGETHPAYNSNPPTSGWHYGDGVGGAGIHDSEVPDELLVHSLEHGAVILTYNENLPQSEIENLKQIFRQTTGKGIMVPRKNLDVPVALTSWGRLLKLQTIDEKTIKEFFATNSGRGPEVATMF